MKRALVRGALLTQEHLHRFARPTRAFRALQLLAQLEPRGNELPRIAGKFERVHEPSYCRGARLAACRGRVGSNEARPCSLKHLVFLQLYTQCFPVTSRLIPGRIGGKWTMLNCIL